MSASCYAGRHHKLYTTDTILELLQFWNLITGYLPEETSINYLIRTFAMISAIRKYLFPAGVVNVCNSLPDYIVDVDSVNTFKSRF